MVHRNIDLVNNVVEDNTQGGVLQQVEGHFDFTERSDVTNDHRL